MRGLHPWGVFRVHTRTVMVRGPTGFPRAKSVRHYERYSHHKTEARAREVLGDAPPHDMVVMRTGWGRRR